MRYHKVIICGSREAQSIELVDAYNEVLRKLFLKLLRNRVPEQLIVIEGGALGVDSLVGLRAIQLGCGHVQVMAHWKIYRRGAGPIRNSWMLALQPDAVYGVHHDFESSLGTLNCLKQAEDLGMEDVFRCVVSIPNRSPSMSTSSRRSPAERP